MSSFAMARLCLLPVSRTCPVHRLAPIVASMMTVAPSRPFETCRRNLSSTTVDAANLAEVLTSADIKLNALGEPCLQALGLGRHYTPVGLVQCLLEYFHADFGLSWCSSIALCALIVRIALFPVVVFSQRNAAKVKIYTPRLQQLQSELMAARIRGDTVDALRLANELMVFMKKNKIQPLKNLIPVLIQVPVFLSVFLAVRGLSNFPLVSMIDGGMLWFPDLTQPDMFYVLPLIAMTTVFATVEVGFYTGTTPVQPALKLGMRLLPLITFPVCCRFTSAVVFYWVTTNFISLSQVLLLTIPSVRKKLDIPQLTVATSGVVKANSPKKGVIQQFRESMSNARLLSEIEDRERLDAEKFRRAGVGAIVPTFKENPKKPVD